jgi:cell shape-determining protein MreC
MTVAQEKKQDMKVKRQKISEFEEELNRLRELCAQKV